MDARGRLDADEAKAVALAADRAARLGIDRVEARQVAHIALWRTMFTRRPDRPQDAMRVARNAAMDLARAEIGRHAGSVRQRMEAGYELAADTRRSSDCPESALRAKQAVALLDAGPDGMRRALLGVVTCGSVSAAAAAIGVTGQAVTNQLRRARRILAAAMDT